jgi:D-alanine-D-alanine ligase-like ATP-grasp enzyme
MARDKSYLSRFLASSGFSVLPETTIARRDVKNGAINPSKWEDIAGFADRQGWHTVVKPNGMSGGRGVRITKNRAQLLEAISCTLEMDSVCIIQQFCEMPEYRVVVLKGKVIQAYRRKPMTIIGDGHSTYESILTGRIQKIATDRNEGGLGELLSASRQKLEADGYELNDIAPPNERIVLSETSNLSTGGEADDVMPVLHPRWRDLSADIAGSCGLVLCGIDIFIDDIERNTGDYRLIEVNSAPGLDDYALRGEAQKDRVKALYREVLEVAATSVQEWKTVT